MSEKQTARANVSERCLTGLKAFCDDHTVSRSVAFRVLNAIDVLELFERLCRRIELERQCVGIKRTSQALVLRALRSRLFGEGRGRLVAVYKRDLEVIDRLCKMLGMGHGGRDFVLSRVLGDYETIKIMSAELRENPTIYQTDIFRIRNVLDCPCEHD